MYRYLVWRGPPLWQASGIAAGGSNRMVYHGSGERKDPKGPGQFYRGTSAPDRIRRRLKNHSRHALIWELVSIYISASASNRPYNSPNPSGIDSWEGLGIFDRAVSKFDELVKSRHSGGNRSPENF